MVAVSEYIRVEDCIFEVHITLEGLLELRIRVSKLSMSSRTMSPIEGFHGRSM